MTTQEFNNEFDISYNAIAGQSAPNIDLYEKSLYLTRAQEEIVKNYYDPASNLKRKGFEGSEKRRRDLNELVKNYKTSEALNDSSKIHTSSRFFKIPEDVFFIVQEQAIIKSGDCYNGNSTNVKPVTHDEFNIQIKNPFKQPNHKVTWRLDISKLNGKRVVELISPYNIGGELEYQVRYIKYPNPIILADLDEYFPGENLSINGKTQEKTCELSEGICREIINRAVELAMVDYNPQNLQAKMQVDLRDE